MRGAWSRGLDFGIAYCPLWRRVGALGIREFSFLERGALLGQPLGQKTLRPANKGFYSSLREHSGGGDSLLRTRLHPKFPDNREINRDFFDFGPLSAIYASNRRAHSMACKQIPYAT
jgi:hypothetical protein